MVFRHDHSEESRINFDEHWTIDSDFRLSKHELFSAANSGNFNQFPRCLKFFSNAVTISFFVLWVLHNWENTLSKFEDDRTTQILTRCGADLFVYRKTQNWLSSKVFPHELHLKFVAFSQLRPTSCWGKKYGSKNFHGRMANFSLHELVKNITTWLLRNRSQLRQSLNLPFVSLIWTKQQSKNWDSKLQKIKIQTSKSCWRSQDTSKQVCRWRQFFPASKEWKLSCRRKQKLTKLKNYVTVQTTSFHV